VLRISAMAYTRKLRADDPWKVPVRVGVTTSEFGLPGTVRPCFCESFGTQKECMTSFRRDPSSCGAPSGSSATVRRAVFRYVKLPRELLAGQPLLPKDRSPRLPFSVEHDRADD